MTDEELGPIDYLAVEFTAGRFTGEDFSMLLDAVDREVVRVLDLEFIVKDGDGTVRKVEVDQLENPAGVDLTVWEGSSSGLLDASDVAEVGAAIEPGSLAGILIYENLWAVSLAAGLGRHGARLIADGRISPEEIVVALDRTEAA